MEPNAQDQLNKEPLNKARNYVLAVSASANIRQFSSRQTVDINRTELNSKHPTNVANSISPTK